MSPLKGSSIYAGEKKCFICGKSFLSRNPRALNCSEECSKKYRQLADAKRQEQKELKEQELILSSPKKSYKTIDEVIREIRAYNLEHPNSPPISYGKYVEHIRNDTI